MHEGFLAIFCSDKGLCSVLSITFPERHRETENLDEANSYRCCKQWKNCCLLGVSGEVKQDTSPVLKPTSVYETEGNWIKFKCERL